MSSSPFQSAIDYTLSALLDCDDYRRILPPDSLVYSGSPADREDQPGVTILPSGFFTEALYKSPDCLPQLPLAKLNEVPLLFGQPSVEKRGKRLMVSADIVASAYFLLTRFEEVLRPNIRDEHGRFPGRESLPVRAGFIDRPLVDEYGELLRGWLEEVGIEAPRPERRFSCLITHDVDDLRKFRNPALRLARTAAAILLGRQPIANLAEIVKVILGKAPDPWDNFDYLVQTDACYTANSAVPFEIAYFLMAGHVSSRDGDYTLDDPAFAQVLKTISAAHPTIGLHPSYTAGPDAARVADEKRRLEARIGQTIEGCRFHYLAWREISEGGGLASAGFRWDSSLGYPDAPGFRLGVCRPTPLFDPVQLKPLGIIERPLLVMDATLSRPEYLGLSLEEAAERCFRLVDVTRRHQGEFVLLWHNNSFARAPGNYHHELYQRLLSYIFSESIQHAC